MLDGALCTNGRARRARGWAAAPLSIENLPMGNPFIDGGARRGKPVAQPWVVGRGERILPREHRRSAPRALTVPNELTKGMFVGWERAA